MPSRSVLIAIMALAANAFPSMDPMLLWRRGVSDVCLSYADAKQVAHNWQQLIGNYSKDLAEAALTEDYHDYSASALTLNSVCLQARGPSVNATDPLFTNRDIFEMAQGSQASIPSTAFEIWHNCKKVFMRWELCISGNCTIPVLGLIAFDTVEAPAGNKYPYQINTTWSEFDSGAWIKNLQNADDCVDPSTGQTSRM